MTASCLHSAGTAARLQSDESVFGLWTVTLILRSRAAQGASHGSLLTNVHFCQQVAIAPLCATVLNERGYDEDDDDDDDDVVVDNVEAEKTRVRMMIKVLRL